MMDGKNVVNIIYNIYISPNNVSQKLAYIDNASSFLHNLHWPYVNPLSSPFPLYANLPSPSHAKTEKRRCAVTDWDSFPESPITTCRVTRKALWDHTDKYGNASIICIRNLRGVLRYAKSSECNITSAARFVAKLFLSQLICFFSPFSAPRNYHIAIS